MTLRKLLCLLLSVVLLISLAGCFGAPQQPLISDADPTFPENESDLDGIADTSSSDEPTSESGSMETDDPISFSDETKRVGKEDFGFVTVPEMWVDFKDVNESTTAQYSDISGSYIVSLDNNKNVEIEDPELWAQVILLQMDSYGSTDFEGATIEYMGYPCYQCYGTFPDGTIWVVHIFTVDDGSIRYLSIEGPISGFMEIYELVSESYSVSE